MATAVEPEVIAYLNARLGDRSAAADQKRLRALADMGQDRLDRYTTARNYYEGAQGTLLTDRQKAYLERSHLPYNENFCATVVDALAERLHVIGVTTDTGYDPTPDELAAGEEADDEFGSWLWSTFDESAGDILQSDVHAECTTTGDAFVIVDWDARRNHVRYTFNPSDMVKVVYEDREVVCAVKVWNSTKTSVVNPTGRPVRRMNVYWPDRVDKWFTPAKQGEDAEDEWVEWLDPDDVTWPTQWKDTAGTPLGVPVLHFANMRRGDGYGVPEHYATIPQQDRLNKELLDLSSVMDAQGFPQRWAKGVSDTSSLTTDPGVVWQSDNPTAEFGQFPAADPAGALRSVESTLVRIATRSRTPVHLIYTIGGYPSGEALKTAESGLVKKAKMRQVYHGGTWAELLRMGALVALAFGKEDQRPSLTPDEVRGASINVQWDDPETRNEKEHLDALTVMDTLGVSQDTILSMIPGIDPRAEAARKDAAQAKEPGIGEAMLNGAVNPTEMMPEDMVAGMVGRNGRG